MPEHGSSQHFSFWGRAPIFVHICIVWKVLMRTKWNDKGKMGNRKIVINVTCPGQDMTQAFLSSVAYACRDKNQENEHVYSTTQIAILATKAVNKPLHVTCTARSMISLMLISITSCTCSSHFSTAPRASEVEIVSLRGTYRHHVNTNICKQ